MPMRFQAFSLPVINFALDIFKYYTELAIQLIVGRKKGLESRLLDRKTRAKFKSSTATVIEFMKMKKQKMKNLENHVYLYYIFAPP